MSNLTLHGTTDENRLWLLNETPLGAAIEELAHNEVGVVTAHTSQYAIIACASAARGESGREITISIISGGTEAERKAYAAEIRPRLLEKGEIREGHYAKSRN